MCAALLAPYVHDWVTGFDSVNESNGLPSWGETDWRSQPTTPGTQCGRYFEQSYDASLFWVRSSLSTGVMQWSEIRGGSITCESRPEMETITTTSMSKDTSGTKVAARIFGILAIVVVSTGVFVPLRAAVTKARLVFGICVILAFVFEMVTLFFVGWGHCENTNSRAGRFSWGDCDGFFWSQGLMIVAGVLCVALFVHEQLARKNISSANRAPDAVTLGNAGTTEQP